MTAQTVANCFHQAGFAATLCIGANDSPDPPAVQAEEEEEDDDIPLARLFPAGGVTFDDYATVDDAVETCEEPKKSWHHAFPVMLDMTTTATWRKKMKTNITQMPRQLPRRQATS